MTAEYGFGVIGAGTWGALHAAVYQSIPGARLAGVCDQNEARARQAAGASGAQVYTHFQDILADPQVKAVSVVLPDFLHGKAVMAALKAGKQVLVEKPLATTEAEAVAMVQAAEAAGLVLAVDFHNRWSPLFAGVRQAMEEGRLGDLQLITYRLSDTLEVPTHMLSWAGQSTVAWFLSSHCLDTLLWLLGARAGQDRIIRLNCIKRQRLLQAQGIPTADFYLTTLEWESGLVTLLENSWILPHSGPSIFDLQCQVIGANGTALVDGSHHRALQIHSDRINFPDTMVCPRIFGRPQGFGTESIRHFAACVMEGRRPEVDGRDGLAVTRLILKMEESAATGQTVPIGEIYRLAQ